nr:HAMP domain-containing sensor histidine kinase [Pedobacter sp. SYSU D00873]
MIGSLKDISSYSFELIPVLQLDSDVHKNTLQDGDLFLIGPLTINPVQQVQRAHQQNPLISIVVLAFPEQIQNTRRSIQFGFNVGKNVTVVPYQFGKDITSILESGISRTKQRASFRKIQQQSSFPAAASKEATFHTLGIFLENAPIGAIVFDKEKKVISANIKAKRFFDKRLDFRYKVTWADLFPGEEYPTQTEEGSESVHEIIKVNGQFLEINISTFLLEKDKPHSLLLINDVTRTITVENQLKNKVEELEFLNRELDEFVNVVSHDFKTPLTSISLLTDLALKEKSQEKQVYLLQQIKKSSDKLKEQLKGLNTLVDIKKKRSDKVEVVDLQSTLNSVLGEHQELLQKIGASISTNFTGAPDLPYFKAHINSFLNNMITNAIKYRKPDVPLTVEITSRREKEYTIITVKDNGIGIDLEKNLNLLFQPFKRLTDQGTGSGLGLSMVKRMIEHNQGYIEVNSTVGIGTEFKAFFRRL